LGNIQVGALNWNGTAVKTLSLFAGPAYTVTVLGAVTPTASGQGDLVIGDAQQTGGWTPLSVYLDGGGSLGAGEANASASSQHPLNSVELNAVDNILIGSSAFVSAIDGFSPPNPITKVNIIAQIPKGVSPVGDINRIFLAANTLTLRADNAIVQQNTGLSGQQTGVVLTNGLKASTVLTLGRTGTPTAGVSSPQIIDLSLSFFNANGTLINSRDAAVSPGITFEQPLNASSYYRVNGCEVHVSGACTPLPNTVYTLDIDKLIEGVQIANEDVAPTDDPTITGAGNEEIWRGPSCDRNGDTPCP
jgi:hypothetical protein